MKANDLLTCEVMGPKTIPGIVFENTSAPPGPNGQRRAELFCFVQTRTYVLNTELRHAVTHHPSLVQPASQSSQGGAEAN